MGGKGCTGEMQGVPANSSEGPGRNVGAHITATPMAAPMRVPMAIRAAHTDVQSSAILSDLARAISFLKATPPSLTMADRDGLAAKHPSTIPNLKKPQKCRSVCPLSTVKSEIS